MTEKDFVKKIPEIWKGDAQGKAELELRAREKAHSARNAVEENNSKIAEAQATLDKLRPSYIHAKAALSTNANIDRIARLRYEQTIKDYEAFDEYIEKLKAYGSHLTEELFEIAEDVDDAGINPKDPFYS